MKLLSGPVAPEQAAYSSFQKRPASVVLPFQNLTGDAEQEYFVDGMGFRRIEVLTGPGRRRRWSAEEKARIVADHIGAWARVPEIARRWQICPQPPRDCRRDLLDPPFASSNA